MQSLDEEPYEEWDDYRGMVSLPNDPPRRVVVLEEGRQNAIFDSKELWVYHIDAEKPVELPYFDPWGKTDEELRRKIKTYLPFR